MRFIDKLIEAFDLSKEEDMTWIEILKGKKKAKALLNKIAKEKLDEYDIIALNNSYDVGLDPYSLLEEEFKIKYIEELKKEIKDEPSD